MLTRLRHSFVLRHSSFVIRHFPLLPACRAVAWAEAGCLLFTSALDVGRSAFDVCFLLYAALSLGDH
jgi:hypothetical protein